MENLHYRKDNKKLLLWVYIAFLLLIITSLIINILNTKKVLNMYILLIVSSSLILSYIIFYIFLIHKNKQPLKLDDNNLAFYVSLNKHNKALKLSSIIIDILQLLLLIFSTIYYIYIMKFNEIYGIYPLLGILLLVVINTYIIIKDILKYKSLDRIDAHTSSIQFSIIDKKLLFSLTLIAISLANVGILSFTKPHFVVHYIDLVLFEVFSTILLIISLSSIFITKIYYYTFDIKQIEQQSFDSRFLEEIGEGNYAKVYKAYIPSLDTVYALKKLTTNDPQMIERFKAEFTIMKALDHQNLVRVYSFDEMKYEYIMDYCKYSLYDYIPNHNLSNEQKKDITLQILNAFEYLHNHDIMHRDVSYYNIMVNETPKNEIIIKVMDFGIAKDNNIKRTRTLTHIRGTLIDPTLSEFKKYNEQNDIYGLGFLINFIHYNSDSIIQDDSSISKIINKCMDLNLSNRYHHVSEIINDYKEVSL